MGLQSVHFLQKCCHQAKKIHLSSKFSCSTELCLNQVYNNWSSPLVKAFSTGKKLQKHNASEILKPSESVRPLEPNITVLEGSVTGTLPESSPKIKKTIVDEVNSSKTHFGFQSVPEELKETLVGKVFSSVASSYDVMNDFMSFGIHRLWKDHFIHTMAPGPGTKLLDVAGGTGDIALRFLEYCQKIHNDNTAHVRVVDINPSMLAHGSERYHKSQFKQNNQALFQVGNAECLENVEDNSVDVYTISFGIRNCTHIDRVLKEAYRVLKPGGRFMCLEFSKVDAPFVKQMYDLYSFQIIPQLGSIVANDRDSYQYLVESIRQFPDQKRFSQMIQEAGFATVGDGYENLTFGVAAMHTGYKF